VLTWNIESIKSIIGSSSKRWEEDGERNESGEGRKR